MSVEAKTLECPNEDCDRDRASKMLATFVRDTPYCPTCGEVLD